MTSMISDKLLRGQISLSKETPSFIHALGAVPRPDGRIRPITDSSRPATWINDYMVLIAPSFQFSNIEDTREIIYPGGLGAVVDISNAYRSVAVFPGDRKYLGFAWEVNGVEHIFNDNMLCFGLKSAPAVFNAISDFVGRSMKSKGLEIIGYLDDYFLASEELQGCLDKQRSLIDFLERIGF